MLWTRLPISVPPFYGLRARRRCWTRPRSWRKSRRGRRSSRCSCRRACRGSGRRGRCWCRASAADKVELADTRVPEAALGILVDMVEGHSIRRIDFCSRIITPADATVESDSREHDGFSLPHVTWRIIGETSGVPNGRKDCSARSGITYDRITALIDSYAGHPAP